MLHIKQNSTHDSTEVLDALDATDSLGLPWGPPGGGVTGVYKWSEMLEDVKWLLI